MLTPDWIDAFGRPHRLVCMTSEHIRAAMNYIVRRDGEFGRLVQSGRSGFSYDEWRTELARRAR